MSSTKRVWLALLLLAVGLVGHLLAANVEGGHAIHYRHHVTGFVLLAVVTTIVVVGLRRVFWRGRPEPGLLTVAAIQAVFGLLVYVLFAVR